MAFRVQRRRCATCIYRPESPLDLTTLEAQIADPHMAGSFLGYRVCHHAPEDSGICCHGFWAKHKDHFTAGQLAPRLGCVEFVDVDCFANNTKG